MLAILPIMIIAFIVGSIANANAKANRTIYENEDHKNELALKYATKKYQAGTGYMIESKEWEIDDVSVGYPDENGFPIVLDLKRGVYPFNDKTTMAIPETLSDATLNQMVEDDKNAIQEGGLDILNQAKQI